nr:hypothetical protein L203_05313 [Cryptococcus depauperatus CBS 7841]
MSASLPPRPRPTPLTQIQKNVNVAGIGVVQESYSIRQPSPNTTTTAATTHCHGTIELQKKSQRQLINTAQHNLPLNIFSARGDATLTFQNPAMVPRWVERRDATRRARCRSGMTPCEASVVTADVTASRSANGRGGRRATSAGLHWWWWLSGSVAQQRNGVAAQHGEWRNPIGHPDRVSPYPGAERSLIRRRQSRTGCAAMGHSPSLQHDCRIRVGPLVFPHLLVALRLEQRVEDEVPRATSGGWVDCLDSIPLALAMAVANLTIDEVCRLIASSSGYHVVFMHKSLRILYQHPYIPKYTNRKNEWKDAEN